MNHDFKAFLKTIFYYGFWGPIIGSFILVPGAFLYLWVMNIIKTGEFNIAIDGVGTFIAAPFFALIFAHVFMGVPALVTGVIMHFIPQHSLPKVQLAAIMGGFASTAIWTEGVSSSLGGGMFAWYWFALTGAVAALMLARRHFLRRD